MESSAVEKMAMRGSGLGSTPNDNPTFAGKIDLPYTLTTGRAAATFLAELANKKIAGSRCSECKEVTVPAQDFCAACGTTLEELVEVSASGELAGFTETAEGLIGLIRLDGAANEFPHRLLDTEFGSLSVGDRVQVRWAAEPEGSILDIEGFEPGGEPGGEVVPLEASAEPVLEQKYGMRLDYEHAYGPYYGMLFDGLATSRRIQGSRCPSCTRVLVPPREYCDVCYVRTGEWVDVADTGTIKAFSIIHLEFVGQTREPPYVYAEIVLDGSATRLIHTVGGIDIEEAKERLRIGTKVRAVWKEGGEPVGTLEDIDHFEPLFEE
ncbi:MAG TPA: OB-fold domain-containing protein [Solirubrobacterales bacterium]|nr:OB-fold domain-containing protein [Solirubrobacterales bacterium]